MRLWNACANVAYGMSRLYWSNLPDANRPRGGTSGLWSSFTTADLPMPEYPDTSTSSGRPPATTRSNAVSRVSTSRSRPYSFSGIIEAIRSVMSAGREIVDGSLRFPLRQAAPQIASQPPPRSDTAPRRSSRAASS